MICSNVHRVFNFNKWFPAMGIALVVLLLQSCSGDVEGECREQAAETLPMDSLSLNSLDAFHSVGGNWTIAGDIESNRRQVHNLQSIDGRGTLVNIPSGEAKDHLITKWTHGDLELEVDFLMPGGSDSGLFLMGRYEVQLADSWGVENTGYPGLGSVYPQVGQDSTPGKKGYEGHAPRMNVARAPGLWQHAKILFKAPAFNEQNEKIANAEFEEVWINGVLVQEGIEVEGPTRAAPFNNEQPEGPLVIQGDQGPVAVRNISYKKYDKDSIGLYDLRYTYYDKSFDQLPEFDTLDVTESGTVDSLSGSVVDKGDRYALRYDGTFEAPNSGTYLFKLRNAGKIRLVVGDNIIFEQDRFYRMHEPVSETVELESGRHDFTLEYIDHHNDWYRGLALFAEGPRLRYQKLHAAASVPGGGGPLPDLMVEAGDRVKVLRSFAMHDDTKRTHVVNVGAPNKIHYSYDMGQVALLQAWNGSFLNAKEMWINRGESQTARPAGPAFSFDGRPVAARLPTATAEWPDSLSWDQLRVEGYRISEDGRPVFRYMLDGVRIEDSFEGFAEDRRLVRTVHVEANESRNGFWLHLASGEEIIQDEAGEYVVDDRTFYLDIIDAGGGRPRIVKTGKGQDLRIPVLTKSPAARVEYAIIW
ncbi:PA14 domain-containing protein [Fodinibius roseus]|uniref:PA14 domain-containing protein n=1 Tax=Fodinibius roseus TaxID=1194090 RepID=A0A1M5F1U2_9BACT|nr:family 16 glycoside hydrolase [Fodinibius roseus]SHF85417.1 PA14 domain-containing protein [Fodinibius roseus]